MQQDAGVPTLDALRHLLPTTFDGEQAGQQLQSVEPLARLWAGYGWILRLHFVADQSEVHRTAILKYVDFAGAITAAGDAAHGHGHEGLDEGTTRKLASYRVEANYYQYLSSHFNEPSVSSSLAPTWRPFASVPRFLGPCQPSTEPAPLLLLLEDVQPTHPVMGVKPAEMTWGQCLAALDWFAGFHACYWEFDEGQAEMCPPPRELMAATRGRAERGGESLSGKGVWQYGTYNYLSTRLDELKRIPASSPFAELRGPLAFAVEWLLLEGDRRGDKTRSGRTLVHGDAKLANMAFAPSDEDGDEAWHEAASAAAAATQVSTSTSSSHPPRRCHVSTYDFQYVGLGIGVQDFVKFITVAVPVEWLRQERRSTTTEEQGKEFEALSKGEEGLLRFYYTRLTTHLQSRGLSPDYTFPQLLADWDLALIAWLRFTEGWVNPVAAKNEKKDHKAQWLTRRGLEILNRSGWKESVLQRWEKAGKPGGEMLDELSL